ncbi:MAG: hypothetical protein FWC97_05190 [Treponema sp.]|nr:hypothetical protein [Treponema sp.]
MKIFFTLKATMILFVFFVLLTSCATRINASLAADGSAVTAVNMSLQPQVAALLQRMFSAGGLAGERGGSVIDGPAIALSMSGAPGVASVTLRNTSPSALEGQIRIARINEFLSSVDGTAFINFEQGSSGGRIIVTINRDNGPVIIDLLSPEIYDFLNALMAPIVTGEILTAEEYLDIIASFYNPGISEEIALSRILVSVEFPGAITSLRGGTFSGRHAAFDIALLDLLVLETPLVFEAVW